MAESLEKASRRVKEGKGIDIVVFSDARFPVKARGRDTVPGLECPYWVSCFDLVTGGDGRAYGFVSCSQAAVVDRHGVLVGNLSGENDGSRIRRDNCSALGRIEVDPAMAARPFVHGRVEGAYNRRLDVRRPYE